MNTVEEEMLKRDVDKMLLFLREQLSNPVFQPPASDHTVSPNPSPRTMRYQSHTPVSPTAASILKMDTSDRLTKINTIISSGRLSWNFPTLEINKLSQRHALIFIGISEFTQFQMMEIFKLVNSIYIYVCVCFGYMNVDA